MRLAQLDSSAVLVTRLLSHHDSDDRSLQMCAGIHSLQIQDTISESPTGRSHSAASARVATQQASEAGSCKNWCGSGNAWTCKHNLFLCMACSESGAVWSGFEAIAPRGGFRLAHAALMLPVRFVSWSTFLQGPRFPCLRLTWVCDRKP